MGKSFLATSPSLYDSYISSMDIDQIQCMKKKNNSPTGLELDIRSKQSISSKCISNKNYSIYLGYLLTNNMFIKSGSSSDLTVEHFSKQRAASIVANLNMSGDFTNWILHINSLNTSQSNGSNSIDGYYINLIINDLREIGWELYNEV